MINITNVRAISTRLAMAVFALALTSACEAALITPPGVPPPGTDGGSGMDPHAFFDANVAPILMNRCRTCHELDEPNFLVADSYYESVRAYSPSLYVPGEPDMSQIVIHPASAGHTGTDYGSEEERQLVRDWIVLEGMYGMDLDGGTGISLRSMSITVSPLARNTIMLEGVGSPGSRLEFDVATVAGGLRAENIVFTAGGGGLAVSGARFVLIDTVGGGETFSDVFTDTNVRVPAGSSYEVTSPALLPGFTSDHVLAVEFDSAGTL